MKRFIKEYANYKIKLINSNKLMDSEFKTVAINNINKALSYSERGMIMIEETIQIITNPLKNYEA